MFDLIAGGPRHPFYARSAATVVVSLVAHAMVIALAVVLPLLYATDSIPKVPEMMAFVVDAPAPPPPPPAPPPPARPAMKPAPVRPQPAPSPTFAAPVEAPAAIQPETPAASAFDGEGAVEGGIEGGVEGGITGGIVGGLVTAPPPPPPPLPPKGPVRIGGAIKAPGLVKRVEPVYPDIALMAKVGGTVILEAIVGADGSVESVKVLQSVKFLDQAAIDAVKQWRYSPLVLNGVPVPFVLTVTLSFRVP